MLCMLFVSIFIVFMYYFTCISFAIRPSGHKSAIKLIDWWLIYYQWIKQRLILSVSKPSIRLVIIFAFYCCGFCWCSVFVCVTAGHRQMWMLLVISSASKLVTSVSCLGPETILRSCCFIAHLAPDQRGIWWTVLEVPTFGLALASVVSEWLQVLVA